MSDTPHTESFKCPNCGAPIEYDGGGEKTAKCPFCGEPAPVPDRLLPSETVQQGKTSSGSGLMAVVIMAVIFLVIGAIIVSSLTASAAKSVPVPKTVVAVVPTTAPSPTPIPSPSPTPSFVQNTLTFGTPGKGEGQMTNPYLIGVDGKSNVYVADYTGGRVQVFDKNGKYLSSFNNGDPQYLLTGFAVDRKGVVTMTDHKSMVRFNGLTGEKLPALPLPADTGVTSVAVAPYGGLAAVTYPLRSDGSRLGPESIMLYDATGKVKQTLKAAVSSRSGEFEYEIGLAFDGTGNLYAVSTSSSAVFVFDSDGKYVNRFGNDGHAYDQFSSPENIVIDSQQNLYISDARGMSIYDSHGRFIRRFKLPDGSHGMVFDDNDNLWVVQTSSVARYSLGR